MPTARSWSSMRYPPVVRLPVDPAKIGAAAVGLGLIGLAGGAYALARPHVAALAAPNHVGAGATFQVAYALSPGVTAGDYALDGPDGREIARGSISSQSGVITLSVPSARAERRYDLRVTARNAFGSTTQSATVVAAASSAPPKPQARPHQAEPSVHLPTVWLLQDTVQAGTPITVRYITDAETGTVKLIDQDGTERGSALLSARGSSLLIAPQVESQEDFRVVVIARRGTARSEAQVPVRVVRQDANGAAALPGVADSAGTVPVPGAAAAVAGDPIALTSETFFGGEGIVASVVHHQPNLRVVLLDQAGQEVQTVDVAPEDDRVVLEAPHVSADTRYTIVASYGPGTSEESVIHSVIVRTR